MDEGKGYAGWRAVGCLFIILAFSSGLGFYNQAVVLRALIAESGYPPVEASLAVSLFFLVSGLAGLAVALIIERVDVRICMVAGALLGGAALAATGSAESRAELYLAYVLFGVGFAAAGLIPATTIVTRWFRLRRAFALAIASTGLSIGGVVVTPGSAFLIEAIGLRAASPVLGAVFIIGIVPFALLLGVTPAAANDGDHQGASGGPGVLDALRGRLFWSLSGGFLLVMLAQVGAIAHQYGLVSERLPGPLAPLALGVLPLFSIIGRLVGGYFLDRWSTPTFYRAMLMFQALSLAMMAFASGPVVLLVALAIFGITVGNLLMLHPLLVAEGFGALHYGRIFAVSNLLTTLGVAGGPALLGWCFAVTGDYTSPYLLAAVSGVAALGLALAGGRAGHMDSRDARG